MQAIPADRLWSFPVPGGHAYYYIQSEDPLVITPIRYGDCHQIHNKEVEKLGSGDLQEEAPKTRAPPGRSPTKTIKRGKADT